MAETEFTIKVTGTGLELDRTISQELANKIVMFVLSGGKKDDDLGDDQDSREPTPGAAKNTSLGKVSLREYINTHNATKIPQQIVAIGVHCQTKTKSDVFTREALEKGFKEGKVGKPGNLPRDISTAIARGWIAEADEADQYYVTGTGESALAANFSKDVKAGGGKKRKKRSKKTKNAK
jgi:hypothetical protein